MSIGARIGVVLVLIAGAALFLVSLQVDDPKPDPEAPPYLESLNGLDEPCRGGLTPLRSVGNHRMGPR